MSNAFRVVRYTVFNSYFSFFFGGIIFKRLMTLTLAVSLTAGFSIIGVSEVNASTKVSNITPTAARLLLSSSNKLAFNVINNKDFTLETYDSLLPYAGRTLFVVSAKGYTLRDYNVGSAEDRVLTFGNDMYASMINHEYSASEKVIIEELGLDITGNYMKIDAKKADPSYSVKAVTKDLRERALDVWPEVDVSFIDKTDLLTLKVTQSKKNGKISVTQVLDYRDNGVMGQVGSRRVYTIIDKVLIRIDQYGYTGEFNSRVLLSLKALDLKPPLGPYLDWYQVISDPRWVRS
jgi:hypothetical protein